MAVKQRQGDLANKQEDDLWESSMNQVMADIAWIRRILFANIAVSLVTLIVIIAR